MVRSIRINLLLTAFAILAGRLTAQTDSSMSLPDLVQEALRNNPQLNSARHQVASLSTRIDQATAWAAPQLGVEFFQTPVRSFPNPLKNQMEMDYFIEQMVPFPGKLSDMGDAAESNAMMADEGYKALERKVIRQLKSSYYGLYLVQKKIEVNNENQTLMRQFVEIATKQYEVGMSKQPDILRAQTELSTLVNDGINLTKERSVMGAMINTLLNRPVNSPLGVIPEIERDIPPWTFEKLSPIALGTRPELQAMNYNLAMNRSEVALSKKEYFPDFMVKLMYKDMAHTGNDFWSAMIGISIPLTPWSAGKYTARKEETELNVKRAEDDVTSMRNMTLFEVQDALVRLQTDQNLVNLYKHTVIPQAEQTLQSTMTAYQTGKTEFLMLIDAYRTLLKAKLDYYTSTMSFMASQAQLEQAVGLDIQDISARFQ